jgi:hypothetical protein
MKQATTNNRQHPSSNTYLHPKSISTTMPAQLATRGKEGTALGWIWKSHPAFTYRSDLKERMHKMRKDLVPTMEYALFQISIFLPMSAGW